MRAHVNISYPKNFLQAYSFEEHLKPVKVWSKILRISIPSIYSGTTYQLENKRGCFLESSSQFPAENEMITRRRKRNSLRAQSIFSRVEDTVKGEKKWKKRRVGGAQTFSKYRLGVTGGGAGGARSVDVRACAGDAGCCENCGSWKCWPRYGDRVSIELTGWGWGVNFYFLSASAFLRTYTFLCWRTLFFLCPPSPVFLHAEPEQPPGQIYESTCVHKIYTRSKRKWAQIRTSGLKKKNYTRRTRMVRENMGQARS